MEFFKEKRETRSNLNDDIQCKVFICLK